MTRPYAEVIGDPIAHSKSPLIHNFWLKKLGIDAEYRAFHVRAEELADYFTRRRGDAEWRGCNVTIPHKETTLALVDCAEGDPDPVFVGAANVVTPSDNRLIAWNTDVAGFLSPLPNTLKGAHAVVIGAGGAALAVVYGLHNRGVGRLTVMNRTRERAQGVLDESGLTGEALPLLPQIPACDLLVNASSLGMTGQPELSLDLAALNPGAMVYDLVYVPLETELLAKARRLGLPTIDGLTMLIGQAAAAFEKFFGQRPPREHDAELRALLTA